MLKIRDGVDLKELEKYGFVKNDTEYKRYYDFKYPNAVSYIDIKTREIDNVDDSFIGLGIPDENVLLEDLIKNNLVEKVGE